MKKEAFWRSSKNKYYLSSYLAPIEHTHTHITTFLQPNENQHFYYRHFGFYSKVMHIHFSLYKARLQLEVGSRNRIWRFHCVDQLDRKNNSALQDSLQVRKKSITTTTIIPQQKIAGDILKIWIFSIFAFLSRHPKIKPRFWTIS